MQLNEKQKVKFIYGVLEKQFRLYYERAEQDARPSPVRTSSPSLSSRLDNVVYRLGFAMTRREARQLVNHGHVTVNGRKVNIPSYQVKPGMVIALTEKSQSHARRSRTISRITLSVAAPKWLEYDENNLTCKGRCSSRTRRH